MEYPAERVRAIYATAIAKSSEHSRELPKSSPPSLITPGDWQNDSLLNIENQSDQKSRFYVIREPPIFRPNKGPEKVYVAVYQATENVKATIGRTQLRLKGTTPDTLGSWIWMVTGFAYESLDKAPPLFATDKIKVHMSGPDGGLQIPSSCVMTAPDGEQPTFLEEWDSKILQSQALLEPQSVQLLVDHSFEDSAKRKYPFVGIGVRHPWLEDEMIPVCVWDAQPGMAYVLQAGNSWRCFSGNLVPGQRGELDEFLDPSAKKGSNFLVNFDKQASPCHLVFKMGGTFELAH